MKKLLIINHEAVSSYLKLGWSSNKLSQYYNPNDIFDKVKIYANHEKPWNLSEKISIHSMTTKMGIAEANRYLRLYK